MSTQLSIVQLEALINRLLAQQAADADGLSAKLNALAETYALMIHHRLPDVDVDVLPEDCRREVLRRPGCVPR